MINELFIAVAVSLVEKAYTEVMRRTGLKDKLWAVAQRAMAVWKTKRPSAAGRRADLEAMVQAEPAKVKAAAEAAAQKAPTEVRKAVAEYLEQMPGVTKRSLSHKDDPSGRTAPAGLPLNEAKDIVSFLPERPPRFRRGEQPALVPGWTIVELLGTGGFSEVYLGENGTRQAALKFCLDKPFAKALENDAELFTLLQQQGGGQGFVRLQEPYLDADPPCLIFDYVPGGDLTRLVQYWHFSDLSRNEVVWESLRVTCILARIAGRAHRQQQRIVHRDLKPSNILLNPIHTKRIIKNGRNIRRQTVQALVADLGIGGVAAKQALAVSHQMSASETYTTGLRGACTFHYASPQQRAGENPDPRDDVYALGVIAYQSLLGDTTVAPSNYNYMRAELGDRGVSEEVIKTLAYCVHQEAEHRPADGAALAKILKDLSARLEPPDEARPF